MSRRDETFLIYYWEDYEEYQTENPTCYYCLSQTTIDLCLSALRFAGWRTRWRMDRADNNRRFEDRVKWDKIDAWAALAHKELMTDMSCDLQAGFEALAEAISGLTPTVTVNVGGSGSGSGSGSCCTSGYLEETHGGIGGTITQPGSGETIPIYATEPTLGVNPGEFPEGYDNLEEYLLDKCQVANLVVDGFIGSLRGLGALGVFNYIAVVGLIVLAITGAIIFPPAFIPIAAMLIGLMSVEITVLTLFANDVEAHREEWVCAMYKSDTVEDAINALADLIDGVIAFLDLTGPVGMAVKQLALLLVNGDTLNQLFKKTAHLTYPDANCSACDPLCYFFEDGLEGWEFNGDWGTLGEVTWESGSMRMTPLSQSGGSAGLFAISPVFSYEVTGDEVLGMCFTPYGNTVNAQIEAKLNGTWQIINNTNRTPGEAFDLGGPLTTYAGQTLTQLKCRTTRSSSTVDWYVDVHRVGLDCGDCPD